MATSSASALGLQAPAHVPEELVSTFDLFLDPALKTDPHGAIAQLQNGPRVVFLPHRPTLPRPNYVGWLPTRSEDIVAAYKDTDTFSNTGNADLASFVGEKWILGPDAMDPPEHAKYRAILNPLFTPKALAVMEARIHELAAGLIDRFAKDGGCEFVEAFGRPFPVTIFMQLMGLPLEDYQMVNAWEDAILHTSERQKRVTAMKETLVYLRGFIALRRRDPKDDLISVVTHARVDDKLLSDDDIIGFLMLMFTAGLDTVASTGGFIFRHLAEHQDQQKKLRAEPASLQNAVEELLRHYSIVIPTRRVMRDVEFAGVQMKKGDQLILATMLASRDPSLTEHDKVLLDRDRAHLHYAFGTGPHLCVGMYLARRELNIALEEWFARVPQFRIAEGTTPLCHGGTVFGVDRLQLAW